jgi:hypothetical protein
MEIDVTVLAFSFSAFLSLLHQMANIPIDPFAHIHFHLFANIPIDPM